MNWYPQYVLQVGRLNHMLNETIRDELRRLGIKDINAGQALLLFKLGDRFVRSGDFLEQGVYSGTNPNYNFRNLMKMGYLLRQDSDHDRRSYEVYLSPKGKQIRDRIMDLFLRQEAMINAELEVPPDQGSVNQIEQVEQKLLGTIRYIY